MKRKGFTDKFCKTLICMFAFIQAALLILSTRPDSYAETISKGDTIIFGAYEQDNDTSNGAEGIEWRVLYTDGDRALIISKYILDIAPYHNEYSNDGITWEQSYLRKFMNEDFYGTAFNGSEKSIILTTVIKNDDNPKGTDGGNDTQDSIFALSAKEIAEYTEYNCIYDEIGGEYIHPDRMAYYTKYAEAKGGTKWENYDTGFYWLRTPGEIPTEAANISCHGYGVAEDLSYTSSHYVTCATYGVRPAMYISISKYSASASETAAPPETTGSDASKTPAPAQNTASSSEKPSVNTSGNNIGDTNVSSDEDKSWAEILKIDKSTTVMLTFLLSVSGILIIWAIARLKK